MIILRNKLFTISKAVQYKGLLRNLPKNSKPWNLAEKIKETGRFTGSFRDNPVRAAMNGGLDSSRNASRNLFERLAQKASKREVGILRKAQKEVRNPLTDEIRKTELIGAGNNTEKIQKLRKKNQNPRRFFRYSKGMNVQGI